MTTETEKCDPLNQLIHHFYSGNHSFSLNPEDIKKIDWNRQQAFLEATVNSTLLKKYPVSSNFSKIFLKKLIEYLESHQEVHDDLYAQLCLAMKVSNHNNFCYKHYVVGQSLDKIITIKETRNMVVNGTTGLKTWEAALMLSDWALCNKDLFLNKNVLELGSGVGFAGITIAKMCDIKSLVLSDCHDEVLKTITENIQINFPSYEQKVSQPTLFTNGPKTIGATMLDWNKVDHFNEHMVPDLVIGADIVYDPSILKPLCNVLQTFCIKNRDIDIYIASVIRNEETFNGFLETLSSMNLKYEKIEMIKSVFIDWDEKIQKCVLKIKLNN
ncbi:protein-lysine N-methyltransferase EEF2KMT [Anticarsia gemmatalis]|uniref:protein-lysine N-methyltransferase EEF2KMT n=1 Tax=Anticarsia gemmatalis TaxID=129554 RepID=UPI003F7749F2